MFIITQGLLSPLLVTQGYEAATIPPVGNGEVFIVVGTGQVGRVVTGTGQVGRVVTGA